MSSFTNIESYKHKFAKQAFKEWCDSKNWWDQDKCYSYVKTYDNSCLYWRSNRDDNAWLEYPIVVNDKYNSFNHNWDEIWDLKPRKLPEDGSITFDGFVPTYNQCVENNLYPISVIDVVLPHKGSPAYFIEICHTNPVSNKKIEIIKQFNIENSNHINLIEIDAEWILKQTDIPNKLKIKRWLI